MGSEVKMFTRYCWIQCFSAFLVRIEHCGQALLYTFEVESAKPRWRLPSVIRDTETVSWSSRSIGQFPLLTSRVEVSLDSVQWFFTLEIRRLIHRLMSFVCFRAVTSSQVMLQWSSVCRRLPAWARLFLFYFLLRFLFRFIYLKKKNKTKEEIAFLLMSTWVILWDLLYSHASCSPFAIGHHNQCCCGNCVLSEWFLQVSIKNSVIRNKCRTHLWHETPLPRLD